MFFLKNVYYVSENIKSTIFQDFISLLVGLYRKKNENLTKKMKYKNGKHRQKTLLLFGILKFISQCNDYH